MPAKKKERIKVGSVSLPFWKHKEGWRWSWKDAGGKWCYGTRTDKDEAAEAARARARAISNGKLDLDSITGAQADLVRQFIALNPTSEDLRKLKEWRAASDITLPKVVSRWCDSKLAEIHGNETAHLRNVRQWLEKFGKAFSKEPAALLSADQLRNYIEAAHANPKSRREARARIITLWKFAATHDLFHSTEADKLPAYKAETGKSVDIWTPAEMKKLLGGVPDEFLPWLVLASMSGLRSEEIAPKPGTKPPLLWENFRRKSEGGHIELPAASSKVRKRRLVPITPTLEAWLEHINPPKSGIVCPRSPAENITGQIGKLVGGWRKNTLRHSYGSYRAATTKDLNALALEMGTSYRMIEKHYREAVSEEIAAKYWALTPSEVLRK